MAESGFAVQHGEIIDAMVDRNNNARVVPPFQRRLCHRLTGDPEPANRSHHFCTLSCPHQNFYLAGFRVGGLAEPVPRSREAFAPLAYSIESSNFVDVAHFTAVISSATYRVLRRSVDNLQRAV